MAKSLPPWHWLDAQQAAQHASNLHMARPHTWLPPRQFSPAPAQVGEDGLRSLLQTQLGVMNESVQDLAQRCVAESHVDGLWNGVQAPQSPWSKASPPKVHGRSVHIAGMQESRQEEALQDSIKALQASSIAMDGLAHKVDSLTDALIKIGTGLLQWSSHLAPAEQHGMVDILLECLAPLATFDVRLQRLCAGLADGSSKTLAPLMSQDAVPGPCSHLAIEPSALRNAFSPMKEHRSVAQPSATNDATSSVSSPRSRRAWEAQAAPQQGQSYPAASSSARSVDLPSAKKESGDHIFKQLERGAREVAIPVDYFGTGAMHLAGTFSATSESRNGGKVYCQTRLHPMTDVLLVLDEHGNWTVCCSTPGGQPTTEDLVPLAYLTPPSS
mmetsp:Transcript_18264/g.42563  ORF Transcript_18264/g.42563 Transcript_18264/m.42563 type:complete len:385 (-) Transcript_18264:38-1192(-)